MLNSSVESTHLKIKSKINAIRTIFKIILDYVQMNSAGSIISSDLDNLRTSFISGIQSLTNELNEISDAYNLATVHIINKYYTNKSASDSEITREYYQIIVSENYTAAIDQFLNTCQVYINTLSQVYINRGHSKIAESLSRKLHKHLETASIKLTIEPEQCMYNICTDCKIKMDVWPETSELVCSGCGYITTMFGVVFRDDQFYPQDGQKTKHGKYEPSRHYKFWMERIQARETKEFPEAHLDRLKDCVKRDEIAYDDLDCSVMREYLKECGLTKYNDHVPLLIKKITKGARCPPQLTFDEDRDSSIKFNIIMENYDKMAHPGKDHNRPYYPYFIYKILESIFAKQPKKLQILEYIHLQSSETCTKNDLIFEEICSMAGDELGIKYKSTNYVERKRL